MAFKLFLMKRYEGVSISDIEKESGMTRRAIAYYGKDKLGLFYDVIRHYLTDAQNPEFKMPKHDYGSLGYFIGATRKPWPGFTKSTHNRERKPGLISEYLQIA